MWDWESRLESEKKLLLYSKEMMDVLVEGALATPSADVAHFPHRLYQIGPNKN